MPSVSTAEGGGELDVQSRIGLEGNLFDLADLDTGDADEIAARSPETLANVRVVDLLLLEAKLAEDGNQQALPNAHTE